MHPRNDLWGLANAVTRSSQDVEDYDQATEMEKLGAKVIELDKRDWNCVANDVRVA
jgi:hypothetical protein